MSAAATFASWEALCQLGATNMVTLDGTSWSWTANPDRLQNGALRGRVYSHRKGELMRDVGAFKIAADGSVVAPTAFMAVLMVLGNTADAEHQAAHGEREFTDDEKSDMYYLGNGCSMVTECGTILNNDMEG